VISSSDNLLNDFSFSFTIKDNKELSNDGYEFYTSLADNDQLSYSDIDKIKSGAYIYMDLELQYEKIIECNENRSNIWFNTLDGSVEDAELFMQQRESIFKEEQLLNDILTRANNEMPFVNDVVNKNYGSRYDYTISNLNFYKDDLQRSTENLERWDSYHSNVQDEVEQHLSLMNARLDAVSKRTIDNEVENSSFPIPGFGALYSLIGFFVLMTFNRKN
jgi:hypothetical protein